MNPMNDEQFEETTVAKVHDEGEGWSIQRADGWSFYVGADSPVTPQEGMSARFYGKGIGYPVRGLFLDGREVYYRTEEQDKECREIQTYGADAADWLKRWDEGRSVWSIEMGGIGPGYEQCIQITAAEIIRHMLERKYQPAEWEDSETWKRDRDSIEQAGFANERVSALGLSGAQWGAALSLACRMYRDGPRKVLADERVKDRNIQVQRTFPQVA